MSSVIKTFKQTYLDKVQSLLHGRPCRFRESHTDLFRTGTINAYLSFKHIAVSIARQIGPDVISLVMKLKFDRNLESMSNDGGLALSALDAGPIVWINHVEFQLTNGTWVAPNVLLNYECELFVASDERPIEEQDDDCDTDNEILSQIVPAWLARVDALVASHAAVAFDQLREAPPAA